VADSHVLNFCWDFIAGLHVLLLQVQQFVVYKYDSKSKNLNFMKCLKCKIFCQASNF